MCYLGNVGKIKLLREGYDRGTAVINQYACLSVDEQCTHSSKYTKLIASCLI